MDTRFSSSKASEYSNMKFTFTRYRVNAWNYKAMRWTLFRPASYKEIKDNCDYFSNSDKTFLWDMNSTHNKLYFSKFSSGEPTLMKAGTRTSTKASWTFTAE